MRAGLRIENWPRGVPFPSAPPTRRDVAPGSTVVRRRVTSQGIKDLGNPGIRLFAESFGSESTRIRVVPAKSECTYSLFSIYIPWLMQQQPYSPPKFLCTWKLPQDLAPSTLSAVPSLTVTKTSSHPMIKTTRPSLANLRSSKSHRVHRQTHRLLYAVHAPKLRKKNHPTLRFSEHPKNVRRRSRRR